MSAIFEVTVPKGKFVDFENDWELIGAPLKDRCKIRYSKDGTDTKVVIEVKDELVAEIFATDVFGEKGFFTNANWKSIKLF
ncbi:TPA: hypothetical protein DEP58_01160 [Patescibacteria group bacterium]|nr:MAG: hypothetical protein UU98_C0004G0038 [Parcubacteria group bacterium GW2011_GWD2_42_14]HCC04897.1 hypothetical protein [Patescibacteria group bacterium]